MEAEGSSGLDGKKIQVDGVKKSVAFVPAMFLDRRSQFFGVPLIVLRNLFEIEASAEVGSSFKFLEHQRVEVDRPELRGGR